jgi:uncharacterized membrane protein
MSARIRHFAVAFVVAAIVFLLLDLSWLTIMASRLYRPALEHVMREQFYAPAALAFYAIYFTGLVSFVVTPAGGARTALARGALFGLVCYATYDLTNQATIVAWPWRVTLIDLAWGSFVSAVSAWAAWGVAHRRRK